MASGLANSQPVACAPALPLRSKNRRFLQGCEVFCPLHGWSFDVTTGAGLTRPDKPLRSYATQVRDGQVWVAVEPLDPTAG